MRDLGFQSIAPWVISNKTVEAELYLDQKTRKLETVSFNFDLGDLFDPTAWDFGYMPIIVAYTAGWDWCIPHAVRYFSCDHLSSA